MNKSQHFIMGLVGVLALNCSSAVFGQDSLPVYSIEQVPSDYSAVRINESGMVAGSLYVGSELRGYVWKRETGTVMLPYLSGNSACYVYDMNDAGEVVGECSTSIYLDGFPVVWRPSEAGYTIEQLPIPPGMQIGSATAINNRGDIVGTANTKNFPPQGGPVWFNGPGGIVKLYEQGFYYTPTAINESRQIVGGSFRMNLDTGLVEDLGVPEGSFFWTNLYDINESGSAVGYVILSTSEYYAYCVRYTDLEGWRILDYWPSTYNGATGINDAGDVSMLTTIGAGFQPAIYLNDLETFYLLQDLLDPTDPYWYTQLSSGDINNNLQITCTVSNDATDYYGPSLLTPMGVPIIPGDVNLDAHITLDDICAWEASPTDLDGDGLINETDKLWLIDVLDQMGLAAADCNNNQVTDYCALKDGTSEDCNLDGVPNECEPDCSGDGVPDGCESDCNGNGQADPCDLATYSSLDCNENGVPDECDVSETVDHDQIFTPPVVLPPNAVTSRTLVLTDAGTVADIDLTLDTAYRCGDLTVRLIHNGTTATLIDRPTKAGQYISELFYDIVLDDEGTGGEIQKKGHSCCYFDPIVSPPSYQPKDALSLFDGLPILGEWTLEIQTADTYSPVAEWNDWGLVVTNEAVPAGICDCNDNGVADDVDIASGESSDMNGNSVPDECEGPVQGCDGDANGDGTVDPLDAGFVIARFGCLVGQGDPLCDMADTNGDSLVDPLDAGYVQSRFGSCP